MLCFLINIHFLYRYFNSKTINLGATYCKILYAQLTRKTKREYSVHFNLYNTSIDKLITNLYITPLENKNSLGNYSFDH